jgi:tRNA modification GTPase
LINALVGFERAIVHSEAGTTRDVVTQLTAVEGWPIELKDTAGLRDSEHAIERQGVELTKAEICSADLVLAVFDNTEFSNSNWDWEFVQATRAGLVVVNKIDLLSTTELATLDESILHHNHSRQALPPIVAVSAGRRLRIQELVKSIANRLVPDVPDQDQLIPVSPAHLARLQSLVD